MPKIGKPKSKRTPVRLRHKIEKASAAKQRKQKKLAKQNPEWRSRLKKDPGIPNLFPYKDKMLQEIEESKRRKEEEKQRIRQEARARREGISVADDAVAESGADENEDDELLDYDAVDEDEAMDDTPDATSAANPMAALLASARARAADYEDQGDAGAMAEDDEGDDESNASWDDFDATPASQRNPADASRTHQLAFNEVLSASDVLLYVLDARDPPSTRSRSIEATIAADPSKRLVFVLNKIDLVPAAVLAGWLAHLRQSFPALPLRAASTSAPNAKTHAHPPRLSHQSTAATLLRALKAYAAGAGFKRALNVGVIGYPNVGKSSVINALAARLGARNPSCPVGAQAGVTTAMRQVRLDGTLKLLDAPGIVFPSTTSTPTTKKTAAESARLTLLAALPPALQSADPVAAVSLLITRLSASPALLTALLESYSIPALLPDASKDVTTDFLVQVARRRGRLGKGGVPNLHAAAATVVGDWQAGRIEGWVAPPTAKAGDAVAGAARAPDEKKVVGEWAKEFKIEGLWGGGEEGEGEGKVGDDGAMDVVAS